MTTAICRYSIDIGLSPHACMKIPGYAVCSAELGRFDEGFTTAGKKAAAHQNSLRGLFENIVSPADYRKRLNFRGGWYNLMHFYSLDKSARTPGHGHFKYETTSRFAFSTEAPGTVPFFGWYSPRFNDFVVKPAGTWHQGERLGYENSGIVFWAYAEQRQNTVKFRHLSSLTGLENFQTGWDVEANSLVDSALWSEVQSQCFVIASAVEGASQIHRWQSQPGKWLVGLVGQDGRYLVRIEVTGETQFAIEEKCQQKMEEYNTMAKPGERAYGLTYLAVSQPEKVHSSLVKIKRRLF